MHLFLVKDNGYTWKVEATPSTQYYEKYVGLFPINTIELINDLLPSLGYTRV